RANEPELVPTLYERAARWYEQQGLFADALEASLKAGAFAHAAMLIERCIDSANFHNEYHLLCQWMERLPEEMIQAQPELSFQYAQAIMFSTPRRSPASWIRIEPLLQWAEQGFEVQAKSERLGTALELHSGLALFQGDLASMLLFAQRSHPLLARNSEIYSSHLMFRGYGHLLAGNLAAAWQGFLEGYRIAESHSLRTKAFAASLLLGEACFAKGDLLAASRYFHKDLADADENPEIFRQRFIASKETFFAFWVYHNLAMLSYECNELATAQHYLAQAQALGDDPEEEIHVLTSGRIIWARLLHRCGETVRAEHLLRTWERQARWPWVLRAIRACQARLHLEMGNLSAVEHWSRTKDDFFGFPLRERDRNLPYVFQEKEALLMVQLLLAQEKAEEALRALAPWKEKAQAQGRMHALLGILILEALARFAARSLPQARSTLQQALRLAQPENFQRLFLDEGQPMQAMLKSTLKEIQEPELAAYGRRLLQAFEREQMPGAPSSASASSALLDPLTPQENRILQLYPIVGYRYRSEAILSEEVATPAQDGIELLKPLELNRLPGTRIPHLWIERAEQRLCTLDLLDGRFVLLIGPGGITWGEAAPGGAAAWQPTALDWMEICWIWSKAGQQRWASQLRVWCWCGLMVLCGLAQRHLTDQFSEDVYDILPHLQAGMLELRHLF
ncbi:MAG TPA: hypothetical protein VFB12_25995, partial [Ktedonobacteraceae bacterium]|nr:hypothetical protein [Ktedonobacteraceae bacterium]